MPLYQRQTINYYKSQTKTAGWFLPELATLNSNVKTENNLIRKWKTWHKHRQWQWQLIELDAEKKLLRVIIANMSDIVD